MSDSDSIAAARFPPAWASGWGLDSRGAFAEIRWPGMILEMRHIPAGSFSMGSSTETDPHADPDEHPWHPAVISSDFWLARTPVTQAQYAAVMDLNPSHFKGGTLPVESVTWHDACAFCDRLTHLAHAEAALSAGVVFRLPTEAEWEYACRAGTTGAFNDGSDCSNPGGKDTALAELGWHGEGEKGATHPVGELRPNEWGLFDMHGNVWEWCLDGSREYDGLPQTDPLGPMTGAGRVVRGGGFWDGARRCRSASRVASGPGSRGRNLGFRLAAGRDVSPQKDEGGGPGSAERGRGAIPDSRPAQ